MDFIVQHGIDITGITADPLNPALGEDVTLTVNYSNGTSDSFVVAAGVQGPEGPQGIFYIQLFQRFATSTLAEAASTPTGVTWDLDAEPGSHLTIGVTNGWTAVVPSGNDQLFEIRQLVDPVDAVDTVITTDDDLWGIPFQAGSQGPQGDQGVSVTGATITESSDQSNTNGGVRYDLVFDTIDPLGGGSEEDVLPTITFVAPEGDQGRSPQSIAVVPSDPQPADINGIQYDLSITLDDPEGTGVNPVLGPVQFTALRGPKGESGGADIEVAITPTDDTAGDLWLDQNSGKTYFLTTTGSWVQMGGLAQSGETPSGGGIIYSFTNGTTEGTFVVSSTGESDQTVSVMADLTPGWVPDVNPNYLTTVSYSDITGTKPPAEADETPDWVPDTNPEYFNADSGENIVTAINGQNTRISTVRIGTGVINNSELNALNEINTDETIQEQLNGKQPTGNYLTAIPTDSTDYPDGVQNTNVTPDSLSVYTKVQSDGRFASINDVGIGVVEFPVSGSTYPFTIAEHTIYETNGELWLRVGDDVVFNTFGDVVQPTQGDDWHELPGALPTSASAYPTGLQNSNIPNASTSQTGLLTNTDWNTFNGKQNALTAGTDYLAPPGNASASNTGLLTSADWTVFNDKQPAGNYLTAIPSETTDYPVGLQNDQTTYAELQGTKPPATADETPSWVPEVDPNYLTSPVYSVTQVIQPTGSVQYDPVPNEYVGTHSVLPHPNPGTLVRFQVVFMNVGSDMLMTEVTANNIQSGTFDSTWGRLVQNSQFSTIGTWNNTMKRFELYSPWGATNQSDANPFVTWSSTLGNNVTIAADTPARIDVISTGNLEFARVTHTGNNAGIIWNIVT